MNDDLALEFANLLAEWSHQLDRMNQAQTLVYVRDTVIPEFKKAIAPFDSAPA